MDLEDFLSPDRVVIDLRAANKAALLRELARRAAAELSIPADTVCAALLKREGLGSTGMGHGFAIPHTAVKDLRVPFGMLARLSQPLDFDAIDGQPVDLVFLLLLPEPSQGPQLNALASVARRFRDSSILQELRTAKDARTIYEKMVAPVA
jgi:nitrogen PTS system EIIA component